MDGAKTSLHQAWGPNSAQDTQEFLKECYDITLYRTPPCMPNCNAFIERWNRSVREELLDHRIVFGELGLRCLLNEYVEYAPQKLHTVLVRLKIV